MLSICTPQSSGIREWMEWCVTMRWQSTRQNDSDDNNSNYDGDRRLHWRRQDNDGCYIDGATTATATATTRKESKVNKTRRLRREKDRYRQDDVAKSITTIYNAMQYNRTHQNHRETGYQWHAKCKRIGEVQIRLEVVNIWMSTSVKAIS